MSKTSITVIILIVSALLIGLVSSTGSIDSPVRDSGFEGVSLGILLFATIFSVWGIRKQFKHH